MSRAAKRLWLGTALITLLGAASTANAQLHDPAYTQAELDAIDAEVKALIDGSVVKAKSDPKPGEADLLTDVYVSY